ncbi:hypothetical protein BDA96_07G071400 [Sorghum bicolor]|uniref:Secreted protein n=1 Tax=Sorghum bicolor TaxID=4558 RepID=A0A921QL36_SORBI|nr:hypothetical protein BDA96_07G071400 [Sorghum bicolor]
MNVGYGHWSLSTLLSVHWPSVVALASSFAPLTHMSWLPRAPRSLLILSSPFLSSICGLEPCSSLQSMGGPGQVMAWVPWPSRAAA